MLTAGPRASLKRFDRGMLQGKAVHFLLDLTWAGRTFRLSSVDLVVESVETGEALAYDGLLEQTPAFSEALNLFGTSAEVYAVPVTAVLPVDVPQLVARGYDLLQATGELSLWVEGTTYEDRRVVLIGHLADPEYGRAGEPINASLQSELFEDRSVLPDPALVVNAEAWPDLADAADGASYPVVFGNDPATGAVTLSRGYLVDTVNEFVLVAGHLCGSGSVYVNCDSDITGVVVPLVTMADGLGRVVTVADISGSGLLYNVSDGFYVRWSEGAGGAIAIDGASSMSGAGDVLGFLLSRSSMRVDYGRVAAASAYLNRYKLAGCILEGVTPWEFVEANLAPILPMTVVNGPHGVYVIPWRYDATAVDVVERLDVSIDPTLEQVGAVAYSGGRPDLYNRFRLRYNLSQRLGTMTSSVLLSGATEASADALSNVYCRQSQLRYGTQTRDDESTVIREPATAALVVGWWSIATALPARLVTYACGYDRAWLERGNVVSVTDPDLYLSDHIALVDGITYGEAGIELSLRIIENVAQQFHRGT